MNINCSEVNSLRDKQVEQVLARLYASARSDRYKFIGIMARVLLGRVQGKSFHDIVTPQAAKNIYMPISKSQGAFIYQIARALQAKNIIEFGTSFGISTIYLASAVKDNGGGLVIGTELEPSKHACSLENIKAAGLDAFVDVRLGDALVTLQNTPEPLDIILLDGWKDLYIPVLKMLQPRLRIGSIVFADNIYTFKKTLRPYVEYMQSGRNGFESTTLPLGEGLECSVFIGNPVSQLTIG